MASAKRWGGMGRAVEDIGEVLQTKFKHASAFGECEAESIGPDFPMSWHSTSYTLHISKPQPTLITNTTTAISLVFSVLF